MTRVSLAVNWRQGGWRKEKQPLTRGYPEKLKLLFTKIQMKMLTLILYLAGIIGFAFFYKFIDWFEKI